jgi:hypothetical protein
MLNNLTIYSRLEALLEDAITCYKANKQLATSTPAGMAFDAGLIDGIHQCIDAIESLLPNC